MPQRRKDEKANLMYEYYTHGYSMEQVAKAFGVTRQSVYKIFKRRDYALRTKPEPLQFVVFNNCKYSLRNTGYYGKTNGKRTLLHRDVWEFYNGPIAEGFDIHHIDGNRSNNQIKNLELISKSEHSRIYSPHHNQYTKKD